jgi:CHASE2 domain-containing sensor protein
MGAQYYLKAAFDCGKDQFAVFLLITLIAQSLSQAFLYGIAWAPWVPYMAAFLGVFVVFVFPTVS